jgi:hypothetical protein
LLTRVGVPSGVRVQGPTVRIEGLWTAVLELHLEDPVGSAILAAALADGRPLEVTFDETAIPPRITDLNVRMGGATAPRVSIKPSGRRYVTHDDLARYSLVDHDHDASYAKKELYCSASLELVVSPNRRVMQIWSFEDVNAAAVAGSAPLPTTHEEVVSRCVRIVQANVSPPVPNRTCVTTSEIVSLSKAPGETGPGVRVALMELSSSMDHEATVRAVPRSDSRWS